MISLAQLNKTTPPQKKTLKVRTLNVAEAVTIIRNCHQTSKALSKKSAKKSGDNETDVPRLPGH